MLACTPAEVIVVRTLIHLRPACVTLLMYTRRDQDSHKCSSHCILIINVYMAIMRSDIALKRLYDLGGCFREFSDW